MNISKGRWAKAVFALAIVLSVVAAGLSAVSPAEASTDTSSTIKVYRLYSTAASAYGITAHRVVAASSTSDTAITALTSNGWSLEGSLGYTPASSSTPVYEYTKSVTSNGYTANVYAYSTSSSQPSWLSGTWTNNGVVFYGADSDNAGRSAVTQLSKDNSSTYILATETSEIEGNLASWTNLGTAFYVLGSVSVTASAGAGGTISPSGTSTLAIAGSLTYTITPSSGYYLSDVEVNGTSVGALTSYTFYGYAYTGTTDENGTSGVSADASITATFSAYTYQVTASSGSGGSISPAGSTTVTYGASKTYTLTPDAGYKIKAFTVDGTTQTDYSGVATECTYTLSSITAAHTLAVTWEPITYTVAYDANGGTGSMSSQAATYDTALTLKANTFYQLGALFSGWNTAADGSGTFYADGAEVENLTEEQGATVTLYAQWTGLDSSVDVTENGFYLELKAGEAASIELAAGTGYLVYELTESGWELVASSNTSGTIASGETSTALFENTYTGTTSVAVYLAALKTLDGTAAAAGAFSFQLSDGSSVLQTTANAEGGGVIFDALTFTEAGTYTYRIAEVVPTGEDGDSSAGMVYDTSTFLATITVAKDDDGTLEASVAYTTEDGEPVGLPLFENATSPATLVVTKELENAELDNQTFSVEVSFSDGSTEALELSAENDWTATIEVPAGVSWSVDEPDPPSGYTLSTITNATGTAVAGAVVEVVVTNSYAASGSFSLATTKTLVGRQLVDGEFSFTASDEAGTVVRTAVNAADGTVTFDPITVYEAGTWTYLIAEVAGADSTVSYSEAEVEATVTAFDEGDGTLSFDISYSDEGGFVNYAPYGDLEISKTVVDGLSGAEDALFSFSVLLEDAAGAALEGSYPCLIYDAEGELASQDTLESGGIVQLKDGWRAIISELPTGAGYEVAENTPSGYTSTSSGAVGTVAAGETAEASFTNTYAATGSFTISTTKLLSGKTLEEGAYTFLLAAEEGGDAIDEAVNAADGTVTFAPMTVSDEGTWTYYISEVAGDDGNIVYDSSVISATVTATDNGDGTLSCTVSYSQEAFSNEAGTGALTVGKSVSGMEQEDLEGLTFSFSLTLEAQDGVELDAAYTYTIYDATGAAAKTGSFDTGEGLDFQLEDGWTLKVDDLPVGTCYTVVESACDGFVTTSGDTSGSIVAGRTAAAWFENTYDCTGTWTPSATKELAGEELEEGLFTFVLEDAGGDIVATATNTAEGDVVFDDLALDAEDLLKTSRYTLHEVDEAADVDYRYAYDDTVYIVEVSCTDNGDGTLEAQVRYLTEDGEEVDVPVFENRLNDAEFAFTKVSSANTDLTLAGATFTLYRYIAPATTDGDTSYAAEDDLVDEEEVDEASWYLVGSCTSDDDGAVLFEGLETGVLYRLVETEAPGGYLAATGQWNVTISAVGDAWEYDIDAVSTSWGTAPLAFLNADDGSHLLPNRPQTILPTTGAGGVAFIAAGIVLAGAAAFVLRMNNRAPVTRRGEASARPNKRRRGTDAPQIPRGPRRGQA